MTKIYRIGAVGALMDEYEKAVEELQGVLRQISQEEYIFIADPDTDNPDCRSIKTVMNHVVRSGYGYSNYLRKEFGDTWTERKEDYGLDTVEKACAALDEVLQYTEEKLQDKWHWDLDAIAHRLISTTWEQDYHFEQLFEHAIVHILRHRRQIERFLQKMSTHEY